MLDGYSGSWSCGKRAALKFKLVAAADFDQFEQAVVESDGQQKFLNKAELTMLAQGLADSPGQTSASDS